MVHDTPSTFDLALAVAFFLAGGGLAYYLVRLRHFLGLEDEPGPHP